MATRKKTSQKPSAKIAVALARVDAARKSTRPAGARPDALSKLGSRVALHPDHAAVLAVHDGGLLLDSYDLLDTKGVARWLKQAREFGEDLVPFAADSCGNLWCIDSKGAVIGVERQGPVGTFRKSKSLGALLDDLVARLEAGELVVDEQGGISEPIPEPMVKAPPEAKAGRRIEGARADQVKAIIESGDRARLESLLAAGKVDANGRFWWDESLIAAAAGARQKAVVELLLARGCPVDDGKAEGKRTALFTACWGMAPCADLVRFLLQEGADPNALTGFDGTPLHSAVMWEHADALELLLKAGGDPKAKNRAGETVEAAVKRSKGAAKKALLAALGA